MTKEELLEKLGILNTMISKHQAQLNVLIYRYQKAQDEYNKIIADEMEAENGETSKK